jgi:hypothetical protein
MQLGPLRNIWRREKPDPYWDLFLNAAPSDPNNLVADAVRRLPEGDVYPIPADVHSPEVMAAHVKEFARFLGADHCGSVRLRGPDADGGGLFAIVCAFAADYDPRQARGIGGQAPALEGAFVTFVLGAWIRECGYRCTRAEDMDGERLAIAAGLGRRDAAGRLVGLQDGRFLYVADVLRTDLPLAPDGEVAV